MRYIVEYGKALTGYRPKLTTFVRLDTSEQVTPVPEVYELMGTGSYYFDYAFALDSSPDIFFQMDADDSTLPVESRFRSGVISPKDDFIDKRLSKVVTDQITVEAPPVDLTPVTDQVNAIKTFIMGPDNKNISDVYNKVKNLPDSGIAGQAEVDASIAAAKTEIDGRVDAARDTLDTQIKAAVEDARRQLNDLIVSVRTAIMGAAAKSISDIDSYTKNLPLDPASQQAVVDAIAAARDSTNSTVMNSFANLRGSTDQSLTDIYNKVQGLPDQELAQASQVAALPAAIRAELGGADFDSARDTLHRLREAIDANATSLTGISGQLTRALGMLHENSVLDSTTYDSENNLTAGRLRIYSTKEYASQAAAAGESDDTTPGKVAEYIISGNYIGGLLESYVVTREFP